MPRRAPKPPGVRANPRVKQAQKASENLSRIPDLLTAPTMTTEQWDSFRVELLSGSDRASAIVGAAYVETMLETLIIGSFPDITQHTYVELSKQSGPLHSFSAKIVLGFAMGLYSKDFFDDLNIVRQMRNHFAHKLTGSSFKDEAPRKLWKKFKHKDANNDIPDNIADLINNSRIAGLAPNILNTSLERTGYTSVIIDLFHQLADLHFTNRDRKNLADALEKYKPDSELQ
jgi:DNA-binding MltR family transcriptional regulator